MEIVSYHYAKHTQLQPPWVKVETSQSLFLVFTTTQSISLCFRYYRVASRPSHKTSSSRCDSIYISKNYKRYRYLASRAYANWKFQNFTRPQCHAEATYFIVELMIYATPHTPSVRRRNEWNILFGGRNNDFRCGSLFKSCLGQII